MKLTEKYINYGNRFLSQGEPKKALEYYKKVLKLIPQHHIAWNNLGSAFLALGKVSEAQKAYRRALKISPSYADPLYSLGVIAKTQRKLNQAAGFFSQALKHSPVHTKALLGLGRTLIDLGKPKEAERYYKTLLKLNPNQARVWGELAAVYIFQSRTSLAKKTLKKAISLDPALPHLYFNLGMLLKEQEKFKKAIVNFEHAVSLNPNFRPAIQELFFTKREICDWDQIETLEKIMDEKGFDNHFTSILRCDDPALNFRLAKMRSLGLEKAVPQHQFTFNRAKTNPKIRLGYISRDFRDHPSGQMVTPILKYHDRKKFEVYVFSSGADDKSPWRKMAEKADRFLDIRTTDYLEAPKLVNDQKIDILIDSSGPMDYNPMIVPAFRPTPIQVSWMGILGTTGASFYDYVIGDKIVTPLSHSRFYSEKIVHLPCFSWVGFDSSQPTTEFTRSDFNLPKKGIIFAFFSLPTKIDKKTWEIWMRILARVPDSVLWLWKRNSEVVKNLQRYAEAKGVDRKRVIFFEKLPMQEHLERIPLADIALDTLVYQGAQTSTSILGSGTPLITTLGGHFIGRVSASLLTRLKLPELIAKDPKEYEEMAVNLALTPKALTKIKAKLNRVCLQENAYSQKEFVRDLENAYTVMWKNYHEGKIPSPIKIGS